MSKFYWFALVLSFAACQQKTNQSITTPTTPSAPSASLDEEIWATFSTGPCFGYCPEYDMYISENYIKIIKDRNCDKQGAFYTTLSKSDKETLKTLSSGLDWAEIPATHYTNVADLPSRTFSMVMPDTTYSTLWHTKPVDQNLKGMGSFLLKKYDSSDWKPYPFKGLKENEIPNQLMVNLKSGIEVYDWVLGYGSAAANPSHSVDSNGQIWMVKYNPFLVSPEDMRTKLSQDPDLQGFEFVVRTNMR